MDLWERSQHADPVGDTEAEGATQEGRAASGGKEEDDAIGRSYLDMVLSGKLRQSVCRANDSEEGECLLLDNQCTKTGLPVAEILRKKHPDMCVPSVENPTCVAVEKYGEVPQMVPLDFTEDDITWVRIHGIWTYNRPHKPTGCRLYE